MTVSIGVMSLVVLGGFFLLLALGMEIAIAMGLVSLMAFVFFLHEPMSQIGWSSFEEMNSFTLTAVPLFIFMGTMFASTGVVRKLFDAADKLLGGLPGGLASTTIAGTAIFGAMCGSSLAAVATFGTIAFPEMERKGYHHSVSLGTIAVGGTLSVLIPPSIILIIYGGWEGLSVVKLFAAALIPGILLAIMFLITVVIMAKVKPSLFPKPIKVSWKERLVAIRGLAPWLLIICLVLGVIFAGIMTPTEAAALGAFLGIVVAAAYRKLTFAALKESALTTAKVTAMIAFLLIGANVLAFVFHAGGITEAISGAFLQLPFGRYGMLVLVFIMYIILGMVIEDISMLLITLPFAELIVISGLGFHPIWFGVVYVILVEIALVSPPFGLNLFVLKGVVPKYDIMTIARSALIFYPAMMVMLVLLTIFPNIVLWLPSIIYG
jgi:C4-dicarboxylate transporter DctM subunit